jgi:hypothetical protein
MYQKDYILRQIEAFVAVVAALLSLRKSGDYAASLVEVDVACKKHVGLDSRTLTALSEETLVTLFMTGDATQGAIRCAKAALLLNEQAQLCEALNRPAEARRGYRKALVLLEAALTREEQLRTEELQTLVEALRLRLSEDASRTPDSPD